MPPIMDGKKNLNQFATDFTPHNEYYQDLADSMRRFLDEDASDSCSEPFNSAHIPSQESVIEIIQQARRILFPRYYKF